jgi:hypothetical protein
LSKYWLFLPGVKAKLHSGREGQGESPFVRERQWAASKNVASTQQVIFEISKFFKIFHRRIICIFYGLI